VCSWSENDFQLIAAVVSTCLSYISPKVYRHTHIDGFKGVSALLVSINKQMEECFRSGTYLVPSLFWGQDYSKHHAPQHSQTSSLSSSVGSSLSQQAGSESSDEPLLKDIGRTSSSASGNASISKSSKVPHDAAMNCLLNLVTNLGYYPSNAGAEKVSSSVNEAALLRKMVEEGGLTKEEASSRVRFLSVGETRIMSVVDVPDVISDDGLATILIIRDETGKHVWKCCSRHLRSDLRDGMIEGASEPDPPSIPQCVTPFQSHFVPLGYQTEESLDNLFKYMTGMPPTFICEDTMKLFNQEKKLLSLCSMAFLKMFLHITKEEKHRRTDLKTER